MVYPVPVRLAVEMWIRDPPVLVRVAERDSELPTCTLPNAMLVGFEARAPAVTPVPLNAMLSDGLVALLAMAMLPVALPAAAGAKVAVKVALCPLLIVAGRVGPVKLNPLPLADACDMVTLEVPLFVTTTD